jgi:hypothetical protein
MEFMMYMKHVTEGDATMEDRLKWLTEEAKERGENEVDFWTTVIGTLNMVDALKTMYQYDPEPSRTSALKIVPPKIRVDKKKSA